jgi:uncharacterized protein (TIGR00730 family)
MQAVAVYCASNPSVDPRFVQAARDLGRGLAERRIALVYGGAKVGLMGEVAGEVLKHGGKVIGVIPERLVAREVAHTGLTELHVVDTMHTRKQKMADLADAYVALPGGLGTLEELFEVATWQQIGIHEKPVYALNVGGFYDLLFRFLDEAVKTGVLLQNNRDIVKCADDVPSLFSALKL